MLETTSAEPKISTPPSGSARRRAEGKILFRRHDAAKQQHPADAAGSQYEHQQHQGPIPAGAVEYLQKLWGILYRELDWTKGVWVSGYHLLRYILYRLDIRQLRRFPGEPAIPKLETLEEEIRWQQEWGGQDLVDALVNAAQTGDVRVLGTLLEKGASPEVLDESGRSPLSAAVEAGQVEAVRLLLARGASVGFLAGRCSNPGQAALTLLITAAHKGYTEIARLLLEHGVPVNGLTHGLTPLVMAAAYGRWEVVRTLFAYGADWSFQGQGERAWNRAVNMHHDAVLSELRHRAPLGVVLAEGSAPEDPLYPGLGKPSSAERLQ